MYWGGGPGRGTHRWHICSSVDRRILLLPVLAASTDVDPPKQANFTAISHIVAISHPYHQIHNIVSDKQKQNKFDNDIVHDIGKTKTKTRASKSKERVRCSIIAAECSRRVEEAVDKVVSRPDASL
jgi:hypothetical protein